jgi:hypothetical protein
MDDDWVNVPSRERVGPQVFGHSLLMHPTTPDMSGAEIDPGTEIDLAPWLRLTSAFCAAMEQGDSEAIWVYLEEMIGDLVYFSDDITDPRICDLASGPFPEHLLMLMEEPDDPVFDFPLLILVKMTKFFVDFLDIFKERELLARLLNIFLECRYPHKSSLYFLKILSYACQQSPEFREFMIRSGVVELCTSKLCIEEDIDVCHAAVKCLSGLFRRLDTLMPMDDVTMDLQTWINVFVTLRDYLIAIMRVDFEKKRFGDLRCIFFAFESREWRRQTGKG